MKYMIKNIGFESVEKEFNIINSIRKENESLVFHRCDTKKHELSKASYDNLKEEYFEGYCNDTIGLKFEEHLQIKLLIVNYLIENNLLQYTHSMGMRNADEYYKKMVDNFFNMYKYETVDKIKNIIMNIAYCTESAYKKDFINKRIVYTNNYYLDENGMDKVEFTNIWYIMKGIDEISYAMKEEAIYSGIIINADVEFDCLAVSFSKIETANNYDLYINTNNNENLTEKTMNIIKKYKLQIILRE